VLILSRLSKETVGHCCSLCNAYRRECRLGTLAIGQPDASLIAYLPPIGVRFVAIVPNRGWHNRRFAVEWVVDLPVSANCFHFIGKNGTLKELRARQAPWRRLETLLGCRQRCHLGRRRLGQIRQLRVGLCMLAGWIGYVCGCS